jgi:hypothetical protein
MGRSVAERSAAGAGFAGTIALVAGAYSAGA